MDIRIVVETGPVDRHIASIRQRLDTLTPALAAMREVGLDSIRQNFQVGGRPPWPALRRARARGALARAIPLTDTGRLRSSITAALGPRSITFGTNVPYAAIHQFGGTVSIPDMRAAPGRAFRFVTNDGTVLFRRRIRAHTVTIPARPYLVLQPADIQMMGEMLAQYLVRGRV